MKWMGGGLAIRSISCNFEVMKACALPQNLTFEQFHALAERQPDLSGPAVYRLEHTLKDRYAAYPQFDIRSEEFFSLSLADAEAFMRGKLVSDDLADSTYRFVITRMPVGAEYWHMDAQWLYDRFGKLLDRSYYLLDEDDNAVFFGRGKSRLRFRKGDIVEVVGHGEVTLGVVADDGPTVDSFWGLYQRCKGKHGYPADATDDCYYVLDGPGYAYHSHPNPLALMPLSMPLDSDLQAYFGHCLDCADQEDCREKYPTNFFRVDDLDNAGETRVRIVYDREAERHRLSMVSRFANRADTAAVLTDGCDPELLGSLSPWLSDMMLGRSRLWYLIRDYNIRACPIKYVKAEADSH